MKKKTTIRGSPRFYGTAALVGLLEFFLFGTERAVIKTPCITDSLLFAKERIFHQSTVVQLALPI